MQMALLTKDKDELRELIRFTKGDDMLIFAGLPWEYNNKLFNVAAAIQDGRLLGLVPKMNIPNYSEFYEARQFNAGEERTVRVEWDGCAVPYGCRIL